MNKLRFCLLALSVAVCTASAQKPAAVPIDNITVLGEREVRYVGATTTALDTLALRDNLSLSLADVLARNTPLYVKSYGRGSPATISFRGTAPSHTPLLWNGMKITSPMLGTADYSLIPSYFIDNALILHGAGSTAISGGGFGGVISLRTRPATTEGFGMQFIQGVSSFRTFDEFLRLSYATPKLQLSTRAYYVNSRNDFRFVNYDKSPNQEGKFPQERNRNGNFRDFHLMQEFYYKGDSQDSFDAAVWLIDSRRNIPLVSVSYRDDELHINRQSETAVRFSAGWERNVEKLKLGARVGYAYSYLRYTRREDDGSGVLSSMSDARNTTHTALVGFTADWYLTKRLMLSAAATAYLHSVAAREKITDEGYDKIRPETSLRLAARYTPFKRLSVGAELRAESYGKNMIPLIYTAFADLMLWRAAEMRLKISGGKNYRAPTLNDLYYRPGGNPDLKSESGYIFEAGVEGGVTKERFSLTAGVSAYDSRIENWILWLYSGNKGGAVWSPLNIKKVHSYGVEADVKMTVKIGRNWSVRLDGSFGWTPSINCGEPFGENDASIGKQLPYIPLYSTTVTGRLGWRSWALAWKFAHYSERFTTTSMEVGHRLNNVVPYYMNDMSLEKQLSPRWADISIQFCINNLFNEEYVTVLSRPMPGMNFGLFLAFTPKW